MVGVGEHGAHRSDDSHAVKRDLDMRRRVGGSEQQVHALRLEPFVRLQQDARAGAVQVVDAPEIQHHVPHPGGERGIDPLGERFGRAEEYRPFELEQHDAAAVRVEQGGFRGGARAARTHLVAVLLAAHDRAAHAQHEQHHRHADADQHGDRDVAGDRGHRDREDHREIERGRVPVRPVPREHLAHELQRPPVDELHPRDDEDGADHDERQLGELRRERGDDGENDRAMDEKDQRSARAGLVARGRWAHADAAADAAQERRDQVRAADQAQHAVRRGALAGHAFNDARADKRVERGHDRQAEGEKKESRQHVDRGAVNGERQHGAEVIPVRAAPGDGAYGRPELRLQPGGDEQVVRERAKEQAEQRRGQVPRHAAADPDDRDRGRAQRQVEQLYVWERRVKRPQRQPVRQPEHDVQLRIEDQQRGGILEARHDR